MATRTLNNTLFTGKFLIHEAELPSTNQFARKLLSKTNPTDGTVIITDFQSAGRGQAGNSWQSAPGQNITCSIIYNTSFIEARQPYFLNMAVANGLVDLLARRIDESELRIKWPNDILCRGKKVSGILIENTVMGDRLKHSIIGIGLNVNQVEFPGLPGATSLRNECGREFDLHEILQDLCQCLEKHYLRLREGREEETRALYNERLFGRGQELSWQLNGGKLKGTPLGVDDVGRIILETDDGRKAFLHGEISLIKI